MTAELVTIAPTWQESTVCQYLNRPFSKRALAEPLKSCVDLGPVDLEGCMPPGSDSAALKWAQKEASFKDLPPALVYAHNLFLDTAKAMLGPRSYAKSEVTYTSLFSDVKAGETQVAARPHLDAYTPTMASRDVLRIIGFACNRLATEVYQGSTSPDGLSADGELINENELDSSYTKQVIPLGRLILAPPSLMHCPARAPKEHHVKSRLLIVWRLYL